MEIEIGIVSLVDDFLAVDVLAILNHLGSEVVEHLAHLKTKVLLLEAQHSGNALAASEQTDSDLRVGMTLDVVEDHCGAFLGRAHNGAAGTHVTIDAGNLGLGIDLGVGLQILTRHGLQEIEGGTEVMNLVVCHF